MSIPDTRPPFVLGLSVGELPQFQAQYAMSGFLTLQRTVDDFILRASGAQARAVPFPAEAKRIPPALFVCSFSFAGGCCRVSQSRRWKTR